MARHGEVLQHRWVLTMMAKWCRFPPPVLAASLLCQIPAGGVSILAPPFYIRTAALLSSEECFLLSGAIRMACSQRTGSGLSRV